nr:MAG TPA: hypothetical protein [Caudoviricetes sp.]
MNPFLSFFVRYDFLYRYADNNIFYISRLTLFCRGLYMTFL